LKKPSKSIIMLISTLYLCLKAEFTEENYDNLT